MLGGDGLFILGTVWGMVDAGSVRRPAIMSARLYRTVIKGSCSHVWHGRSWDDEAKRPRAHE